MTQLLPCPVVVELRRPDESKVYSQASVDAGAIDAYEDAISDARPSRILCIAVETDLCMRTRETWRHTLKAKWVKHTS